MINMAAKSRSTAPTNEKITENTMVRVLCVLCVAGIAEAAGAEEGVTGIFQVPPPEVIVVYAWLSVGVTCILYSVPSDVIVVQVTGGGEYVGSVGNVVVAADAHVLGVTCDTLLVAVPVGNPSGS